jgi:hypothetical protein
MFNFADEVKNTGPPVAVHVDAPEQFRVAFFGHQKSQFYATVFSVGWFGSNTPLVPGTFICCVAIAKVAYTATS